MLVKSNLKIVVLMFFLFPLRVSSEEQGDVKASLDARMVTPVTGNGQIIKIDDSDEYWVALPSDKRGEIHNKLTAIGVTSFIISNNKNVAFKLKLKNIKTPPIKSKINSFSGVSPVAKSALNHSKREHLGKEIVYICFDASLSGIPNCSVYIDRNDIGYEMLMNGYSKYVMDDGQHPRSHEEYSYAEAAARDLQVGVWQPYYYFVYPDE